MFAVVCSSPHPQAAARRVQSNHTMPGRLSLAHIITHHRATPRRGWTTATGVVCRTEFAVEELLRSPPSEVCGRLTTDDGGEEGECRPDTGIDELS